MNDIELEKLKEKGLNEHIPIIMDDTLEKIKEILLEEKPKRILEIGTAIGYSSIKMALISKKMRITSIERDEERYQEALKNKIE